MGLRLAGYLAFLWTNAVLSWVAVSGDGAAAAFRAWWWLLVLSVMTTLSLVSLSATDPGKIPADDADACHTSNSSRGGPLAQQQQYFTQFCTLCNYQKPARAHHCRICKRCVLKMDHHCHWVGRCVGRGNYKAYLLTLFYACAGSGAMLFFLWRRLTRGPVLGLTGWVKILGLVIDGLVLAVVFCSVFYLLVWHGYLVVGNVTTIEYFKWKRSMRDPGHYALSPGASIRLSEHDGGLWFNLREALGDKVWLWLWPDVGASFGEEWKDGRSREMCLWWRSAGSAAVGEDGEGTSSAGWGWPGAAEAKKSLFERRRSSRFIVSPRAAVAEDRDVDVDGIGLSDLRPRSPSCSSCPSAQPISPL